MRWYLPGALRPWIDSHLGAHGRHGRAPSSTAQKGGSPVRLAYQ
jgi:hypothetical protein